MNREEKAAAIEEVARQITESEAIYAVDYRGASVPQAADLRARLRDADATFRVVKNTLTERAADQAGAEGLKVYLEGPTAMTFVRGDAAAAAKALADFRRSSGLLHVQGRLDERRGAVARPDGRDRAPAQPRRALRPPRRHGGVAAHGPRHEPQRPDRRARPPARRRSPSRASSAAKYPRPQRPPLRPRRRRPQLRLRWRKQLRPQLRLRWRKQLRPQLRLRPRRPSRRKPLRRRRRRLRPRTRRPRKKRPPAKEAAPAAEAAPEPDTAPTEDPSAGETETEKE